MAAKKPTSAAPAGAPNAATAPFVLNGLEASPPVVEAVGLAVLSAGLDCVAATEATEAMDAEADARRGAAAPQYEVTWF